MVILVIANKNDLVTHIDNQGANDYCTGAVYLEFRRGYRHR